MGTVNTRDLRSLVFLAGLCLSFSLPTLQAQTAAAPDVSLLPGAKPPDVPLPWKQLVGIYTRGDTHESFTLLERNQRLYWLNSQNLEQEVAEANEAVWIKLGGQRRTGLSEIRSPGGSVTRLSYLNENYTRTDAGADPEHFFHITLSKPLGEVRAAALAAKPPVEAGPFRKPDLVELATLDIAFHLDIRYAQSNNFLSTPVYSEARAFLQRPAAEALLGVLHELETLGYGLLIHDAYRPWYITKIFWDATPAEDHIFVADPNKGSRHNRGSAVDLTLYDLATGQPIEMPGLYDEMSPRSFPNFPGGTALQRWHRDLLRRAMESKGFSVNEDEWWHFDYKDWKSYPILNVPFEDLRNISGTSAL